MMGPATDIGLAHSASENTRFAPRLRARAWGVALWEVIDAMREGFAMLRHYEQLRAQGVPHATAADSVMQELHKQG